MEIYRAPTQVGWGSLEYGPAPAEKASSPGQLQGGRWKPLHYFYKQSLMTDVMATCGASANVHGHPEPPNENQCFISNHRASRPFNGTVTFREGEWTGATPGGLIRGPQGTQMQEATE